MHHTSKKEIKVLISQLNGFQKKFIVEKTKENSEHQEVIIQRLRKKASSKIFEKIVGKTINNRSLHICFSVI